jgi:Antibiotic biosynthesis monooxygenase
MNASAQTGERERFPDIARSEAGTVMITEWTVGSPEHQKSALEAIVDAWTRIPRPKELLGYCVFLCTDGDSLLHYSLWESAEAAAQSVRAGKRSYVEEIEASVPGIRRHGRAFYRLYKSTPRDAKERVPGCVAVARVEFDGPDPKRQRAWVDAVFEALEEVHPDSGLISAHFHLGTDGARVMKYAEWTDEMAHVEALRAPAGPRWQRVQGFPGMTRHRVKRYRLHRCLGRFAGSDGA